MRKAILFLSVALLGFAPAAMAADAPLTDAQRAEVESIIKDYLTNKHPEVMADGLRNLQKREQASSDALIKEQVASSKDKIYNDPNTPVAGNPKGNVTVVEFYDYQCGYCKMSEESVQRLIKEDKDVKFLYKNFPILGPVSTEAAKAALASQKQGKFPAFHAGLMSKKEHLTTDMIYQVAKDVGLNVDKLKQDMNDAAVNDEITSTLKLGQSLGVRGTPMFIVGDNIGPGALQYTELKQMVDSSRAAAKK